MPLYPTIYNIETGEWEETAPDQEEQEWQQYRQQQAPPTFIDVNTGQSLEVTPQAARDMGVPIGPPRSSGEVRGDIGDTSIPSPTEGPSSYWDTPIAKSNTGNKPQQMFASTEQGVPSGYRYPNQTEDDYNPLEDEERKEEQHRAEVDKDEDKGEAVAPQAPGAYQGSGVPGMVLDNPPAAPTPQTSYTGDFYPSIAQQRAKLVAEIDNNPKLREFAAAAISQEAGHPDGILATVETLFNRTQQRGTSLSRELTNGFYGPVNKGYVDNILRNGVQPWMYKQFDDALDAVRNGSDLSEGRTDQGGIDEIKGPKTKIGDEYFGYMDGDPTWSMQHQRNKGDPSGYSGRRSGTSVPGMELDQPQASGVPGMVLDKQQGAPAGGQPSRLTGLDGAIADAKSAGLTVTSGYRGPNDPLTRANPRSAHAQGRAFDLRAQTGQEADAVIAKQREIFTQRGLREGQDYTFVDEVRRPSGHATGPHVHVQLTERGVANYQGAAQFIPLDGGKPKVASGVPGMVLDPQPEAKSYDTKLTDDEEKKYQTWKAKYAPNDSGADYDLRGAYKAGLTPDPKTGHWPDTYKKPNHPTFSDQSKYATGEDAARAGHWEGDKFVSAKEKVLASVRPEVPSQQLPSGEMAPLTSGGQEQAASAKLLAGEEVVRRAEAPLPKLSPSVARTLGLDKWIDQDTGKEVRRAELAKFEPAPQVVHQKNRAKLQGAIEDLEKEGYTVPHTIGKPNEPEGDRAPTKDMETLRDTLKRKADYEARTGRFDKSKETRKQQEFWDNKIKTEGMSAEEEAIALNQKGEPSLGINTRVMAREGEADLWPIDLTPEQQKIKDKTDALNKERIKLVQTFTPDQPEKAQEIQKLDDQIAAANKEFASLSKAREKELTPEQLRELVTGRKARKEGMAYAQSVAAAGGQQFEQAALSSLAGSQGIQAGATAKQINPFKDAATAKAALPMMERQLAIFKEGVANETAKLDPSDTAQVKRLEAYTQHAQELERKIAFAKARMEGKSGEGFGAAMHRVAKEREAELTEKTMPTVAKKWDKVIDQVNKNDTLHNLSRSVAGSLPSSIPMMALGPLSMPAAAVAGFTAMFTQTYNDKLTEIKESAKRQGKPYNEAEARQIALIAGLTETPLEEIGDLMGAKMFAKALWATSGLKIEAKGAALKKIFESVKSAGKEVGPMLIAEGLVTNPMQSVVDDIINEKHGIQDPTTPMQKLTKAGAAGGEGALSALIMWGIPTATVKGAKYLASLPKPEKFEEVPKGSITVGVPPAGTLTGAAAQMGATGPAADIPYTPPGVTPLPTDPEIQKKQDRIAEIHGQIDAEDNPEKKAALVNEAITLSQEVEGAHQAEPSPAIEPTGPAPVEPTVETEKKPSNYVRDKDGKRGEVVSENNGSYEVEWDDDTRGTVKKEDVTRRESTKITVKNSIQLAPHGKSVAVVRFDNDGNMQNEGTYDSVEEAEVRAKKVAAEHNYAGYEDENSKFVRVAGKPEAKPEVTVAKAAEQPAAAPGEWHGEKAQPGEPGLPPEMQEAFLKAQAKKAQSAASHPNHVEVNDVSNDGAYMMDPHGNIFSVRDTASGRSEDYGTHDNYSLTNLGYPLRDAMKEGWIRVVTDRVFKQVHWDGRDANNAQLRALKDMGAVTGHEVKREGQEFSIARTNRMLGKIEKATGIRGLVQKIGAKLTGKKSAYDILHEQQKKWRGISDADAEAHFRNSGMHAEIEHALRFLGVPIKYVSSTDNAGAPAAVNSYRNQEDANLTLDISAADLIPMIETARATGGDKAAKQIFNAILTEEVLHAADDKTANEEYDALTPTQKRMAQSRGLLNRRKSTGRWQYKQERYTAMIKEAKRIAQAAPAKDARAIARMLAQSFNTYVVPYNEEARGRAGFFGKPEQIFDYLMGPDGMLNEVGLMTISEFLRQAKQYQLTGEISEGTHAHINDKIGKLFKKIINGLKRSLKGIIGTGQLPLVEKALADMDRVLADPSVAKQSSIQSIQHGTQGFTDFVGTTTITIGPDGKHQALYSVGPAAFGNGLGFRFNPEKMARRIADNATAQGQHVGYAMMPVWVRAEQPAMVDVANILRDAQRGGWNNPANVATELVRAGHLTQQEVAAMGQLTNAGLKQALADKGFDSIAFRHGDGPATVIVFDNTQIASATGNENVHSIDDLVKAKDPAAEAIETAIVRLHNEHGGSSYNAVFGDMGGKDFYAVGSFPELSISIKGKDITRQDIIDIRDRALAEGIDLNTKHVVIGTWYNEKTGWTDIDISAMIGDLHTALEIAEQHQQTAIFDLATLEAIMTNGAFPALGGLPSLSERNGFIAAKAAKQIEFLKNEDEFTAIAKENEQYKDWYDRFARYMRDNFLKDYPEYIPLINYFLAATSPNNLVAANFTRMVTALRNFVETGDPGRSKEGKMFMESHYKNLRRSVKLDPETGQPVDEFENISGLKVSEYTPALFGDPSAMAIDMHVANIMFGTTNPTDAQREEAMRMIMRVAKRLNWTYAEVQAAFFAADLVASKVDPETGKIIPGKKVDHYERTAEKRRAEVYKLLDADRKAGGLGAKISAILLERTRKRTGVERLLGTDTRAKQQILRAREVAINEYVANGISLSAPRKAAAKGAPGSATTTTGTATLDVDRRVSSGLGDWFYNGIKHVFWNSPGLHGLGDMVHKHVDLRRKLSGEYLYPIAKWAGSFVQARPAQKKAINEHQEWRQQKAKGLPTPSLSTRAKELKNVIDGLMAKINKRNTTTGIKVKNPAGNYVVIPHIEYPAIIQQKYMDAMRHPNKFQEDWKHIVDNLKAEGIIPKTATEYEARVHVQNFLRQYDSNGDFGSFFFHNKMLPSTVRDYSLGGFQKFVQTWIDKASLAECFGSNPNSDLFEFAKDHTASKDHKDYISRAKALAYGTTVNDFFGRMSSAVGGWASIQHLANWVTATKDLISGQIFNLSILGTKNYVKGFWAQVVHPFNTINDASEQGIILNDIQHIMTDGERIGGTREAVGKVAMSVSFRNFVETFNRGVAYQAGKSMLRHAIYAYDKNPRSSKTLNYMAFLQRLGFREGRQELLLQEKGKGELTGEFLRSLVNAIQAGYTYADVPAFVSEPAGKFWLKYSPWSIEHTRLFFTHVLGPDARNVGLLKKDKVTVLDPATGKKSVVEVPRRPLSTTKFMWYLFLTTAGGAGEEWMLEMMFRMRPKTARWSEIFERFKKNDPRRYNELAAKLFQVNMIVGTFGALGNYIQSGLMMTGVIEGGGRGGLENLSKSLPALDPALKVYDSLKIMFEQKAVTGKSLETLANAVSGIRVAAQTASNLADVFGADYWYSKMVSNRQDMSRVKAIQDRWMKDIGKEKAAAMIGMTRMEKTEESVWREPLQEALSIGDLVWAKKIVADVKASMTQQRWAIESEELKKSIKTSQPIKGSEVVQSEFNKWAKATLAPDDIELIRRVTNTYRDTAKKLPLGIEFKPPDLKDIMEFRNKIKLKQQETTYPWSPFKF